jgi:hypothetical protein
LAAIKINNRLLAEVGKLTSCTSLNNCRVGTARATAQLGFKACSCSAHLTSKSLVANGARSQEKKKGLHGKGKISFPLALPPIWIEILDFGKRYNYLLSGIK